HERCHTLRSRTPFCLPVPDLQTARKGKKHAGCARGYPPQPTHASVSSARILALVTTRGTFDPAGDERRGRLADRWLIAAVTSQLRGRRDERQVRYPAPTRSAVGSSLPGARRAEQFPQLVREVFTTS